jgi:hypothetical protein
MLQTGQIIPALEAIKCENRVLTIPSGSSLQVNGQGIPGCRCGERRNQILRFDEIIYGGN